MAMNVKSSGGDEGDDMGPVAEINVTPLVDVMLVLLIIFMVTAPLMMTQLPIQLPKANLEEMGKPKDPLIVSFDLDGHYYVDTGGGHSEQIDDPALLAARLSALAQAQPDNLVYIRADKTDRYGKVVQLMKMVAEAGFYRVSLMSEAQQ